MSRLVDRGALVAGWIGAGAALVVVIAFQLIIAVQPLVLLAAVPLGAVIGAYANVRAQRRRPRWRVVGNALWAGAVSGLVLAVLYVGVWLIFVYGDSGVRPDGTRLDCPTGPACGYARYVEAGRADALAEIGIVDAASYERAKLAELGYSGLLLFGLTLAGATGAGVFQAAGRRTPSATAVAGVGATAER